MIDHIHHIEDLPIFVEGKELFNSLERFSQNSENFTTTLKYDGSPSIVFGWLKDEFFVATKSFWNKTPETRKICFNESEIRWHYTGEVARLLKTALKYLPNVTPKGCFFQGEVLFDEQIRVNMQIAGMDCAAFQPNTILYVMRDNPAAELAKIGLAVHSQWETETGKRLERVSKFPLTEDVYFADISMPQNIYTIPIKQIPCFTNEFEEMFKEFPKMRKYLKEFSTYCYMNGTTRTRTSFQEFVRLFYQKHSEGLKTAKGREKSQKEWELFQKTFEVQGNPLLWFFEWQRGIVRWKEELLQSLNEYTNDKVRCYFYDEKNQAIRLTAHEGFVVQGEGLTFKLVNRNGFSRENFKRFERA